MVLLIVSLFSLDQFTTWSNSCSMGQSVCCGDIRLVSSAYLDNAFRLDNVLSLPICLLQVKSTWSVNPVISTYVTSGASEIWFLHLLQSPWLTLWCQAGLITVIHYILAWASRTSSDLVELVRSFGLLAHAYADDLQVYCHMNVGSEQIMLQRFRDCADSVSRWMSSNRLKLNPSKTELIWFYSGRRQLSFVENEIELFGSRIAPVHTVRDLGVMLDSNMTMSQHVLRVCQNCYFQIRLIRRLGKALSVESKLLLVHALVHSRLDYYNSVLVRLPWSLVQQLQSVLNSAARLIFGFKRFDRITPALMDLHWLPYPQRITYKLCMIMFKCLRGSALLILLTIVLVLLWCLVDRLWDLLLMVTLLFLVIGQTGV